MCQQDKNINDEHFLFQYASEFTTWSGLPCTTGSLSNAKAVGMPFVRMSWCKCIDQEDLVQVHCIKKELDVCDWLFRL